MASGSTQNVQKQKAVLVFSMSATGTRLLSLARCYVVYLLILWRSNFLISLPHWNIIEQRNLMMNPVGKSQFTIMPEEKEKSYTFVGNYTPLPAPAQLEQTGPLHLPACCLWIYWNWGAWTACCTAQVVRTKFIDPPGIAKRTSTTHLCKLSDVQLVFWCYSMTLL